MSATKIPRISFEARRGPRAGDRGQAPKLNVAIAPMDKEPRGPQSIRPNGLMGKNDGMKLWLDPRKEPRPQAADERPRRIPEQGPILGVKHEPQSGLDRL